MNSKRSSPSSSCPDDALRRAPRSAVRGFTLIEALVALAVTAILIAFGVAVTALTQRATTAEQVRTELNQNLRAALDLMGADIRIAGERLPGNSEGELRAIEVDANELVLRRNLLADTLPVCATDVVPGDTTVQVAAASGSGCAVIDNNGDGVPDRMEPWRDHRVANGGSVRAFITTASGNRSEFFEYVGEDPALMQIGAGSGFANRYELDDAPAIFALTENRYFVQNGTLFLERDGDPASRVRLVPNVDSLAVQVVIENAAGVLETRNLYDATVSIPWNQIRSVDVVIRGRISINGDPYERSLSASYFPRNALSN